MYEKWEIELQISPDAWAFWDVKLTHRAAVEGIKAARKKLPNDVFRIVHIQKRILDD
jgi:hypothetical protein